MYMRLSLSLIVLGLLAGCEPASPGMSPGTHETDHQREKRILVNEWMVNNVADDATAAAIIRQHTLYPYHFCTDGADLNELGLRDVRVLAGHFRCFSGTLNISRGDASGQLYKQRLATVQKALSAEDVDSKRVALRDGLPGGDGIASERLVQILSPKQRFEGQAVGIEDRPTEQTGGFSPSGGYGGGK